MNEIIQNTSETDHATLHNMAGGITQENKIDEKDNNKFLTFIVANEVLGIDILRIKEIIEYENVYAVPLAPDYIRGVINLRGNVTPVIDLSKRLGLSNGVIAKRTSIVLVEVKTDDEVVDVGIVVDAVNKVFHIGNDHIAEAPTFGIEIHSDYIAGMGRIGKDFIVLLNLDKVLDINDLAIKDTE